MVCGNKVNTKDMLQVKSGDQLIIFSLLPDSFGAYSRLF